MPIPPRPNKTTGRPRCCRNRKHGPPRRHRRRPAGWPVRACREARRTSPKKTSAPLMNTIQAMKCPYCGSDVVKRDSSLIYGRSYGVAWVCSRFPECDAYVGCHKGSDRPLGRLANKTLRRRKNEAHAAFDPLWKSGQMSRNEAYHWLAGRLGIPKEECHIGMFDERRCELVVQVCEARALA